MAINGRLGRGLDSLMGIIEENESEEVSINSQSEIKSQNGVLDISISLIDNNPNQPRKNFDANALNELAESIKQHGVIQPIILVKRNGRYLIVAGERRFRACKIAGVKTIPAIVKDYTDSEIKEIALLENIQREDLNPIECAKAFSSLMNEFGWTQEIIADRLGKSRPAIANTLRLLYLCPEVIKMVESGKLSAGHARSLVIVTDPEVQLKLAILATTKKLTVRDLEKAVKESTSKPKTAKTIKTQSDELVSFKNLLEKKFSTKVIVNGTDKKGKIVIEYYNTEDLDRIYDLLK